MTKDEDFYTFLLALLSIIVAGMMIAIIIPAGQTRNEIERAVDAGVAEFVVNEDGDTGLLFKGETETEEVFSRLSADGDKGFKLGTDVIDAAIKNGCGEWQVDPTTGDKEFVYKIVDDAERKKPQ